MNNSSDRLTLLVSDVRAEARDVVVVELRSADGAELPTFTAGAHLEVYLPGGLIRHYSLCNDPSERHRYCIGVGLARDSRGGSKFIHQRLKVGSTLTVSAPRNNFPLTLTAQEYVFIAGGIGITPIRSMIHACQAANKRWKLFYCSRNRQRTAFYENLCQLDGGALSFHFDDEQGGRLFDAKAALSSVGAGAHIYCCGPTPLMRAVEAATADRESDRVHFEWFTAAAVDTTRDQAFRIVLRSSGKSFDVPIGRSILDVLEDNAEGVPYSCREGLCATCKTGVVSGTPDHRDNVLSASEKATNEHIIICVSRAKSEILELDL